LKTHLIHVITLNSVKIGEADRLLDLFSYRHGRLLCTARGASRIKNRFGEASEPISEAKFWVSFKEGRMSVVAKEGVVVDPFRKIHSDFLKLNLAFFISELIRYFFKRNDPAPSFWIFLRKFLKNMEDEINPLLFAFFFIKTLQHNGLLDKICHICGSEIDESAVCEKGGFAHKGCSVGGLYADKAVLNPIFYLTSIKQEKIRTVRLAHDIEKKVAGIMYKMLLMHIDKPLKTAKFWEDYIRNQR